MGVSAVAEIAGQVEAGQTATPRRCIVVLGGSFDPVHRGHLELGTHFATRLNADVLRVLPAGNPWQKSLQAAPEHRIAMLQAAFAAQALPAQTRLELDTQEIERTSVTYTIETLRAIRAEAGAGAAIVFVVGADQLQQFERWREWRAIFSQVHIAVGSRPGFSLDGQDIDAQVAQEFYRRAGSIEQIRSSSHGLTLLSAQLQIDISATRIREALQQGTRDACNIAQFLSPEVLDYIQLHHLYQK